MSEDTKQNSINIAVLQSQYTTLMEDVKEVKVNGLNHENKDQERHTEVMKMVSELKDYIVKEHEELRKEITDIKSQQKVDKVRLGTVITVLATIGSLLLKFLFDAIGTLIR